MYANPHLSQGVHSVETQNRKIREDCRPQKNIKSAFDKWWKKREEEKVIYIYVCVCVCVCVYVWKNVYMYVYN